MDCCRAVVGGEPRAACDARPPHSGPYPAHEGRAGSAGGIEARAILPVVGGPSLGGLRAPNEMAAGPGSPFIKSDGDRAAQTRNATQFGTTSGRS